MADSKCVSITFGRFGLVAVSEQSASTKARAAFVSSILKFAVMLDVAIASSLSVQGFNPSKKTQV